MSVTLNIKDSRPNIQEVVTKFDQIKNYSWFTCTGISSNSSKLFICYKQTNHLFFFEKDHGPTVAANDSWLNPNSTYYNVKYINVKIDVEIFPVSER